MLAHVKINVLIVNKLAYLTTCCLQMNYWQGCFLVKCRCEGKNRIPLTFNVPMDLFFPHSNITSSYECVRFFLYIENVNNKLHWIWWTTSFYISIAMIRRGKKNISISCLAFLFHPYCSVFNEKKKRKILFFLVRTIFITFYWKLCVTQNSTTASSLSST